MESDVESIREEVSLYDEAGPLPPRRGLKRTGLSVRTGLRSSTLSSNQDQELESDLIEVISPSPSFTNQQITLVSTPCASPIYANVAHSVPNSVRFNLQNFRRHRPSNQSQLALKGAFAYITLLILYLIAGSLMLFVIWRWFPTQSGQSVMIESTNSLTGSLWNLTLTYNVLHEEQWRREASTIIKSVIKSHQIKVNPTWSASLLVCLSLISTTGLPEECKPFEHQSLGGQVFTIVYSSLGAPFALFALNRISKLLFNASATRNQRQLRWTIALLLIIFILVIGALVTGSVLNTFLVVSLIGPLPCSTDDSALQIVLNCSFVVTTYVCLAFIIRFFVNSVREPSLTTVSGAPSARFDRQLLYSIRRLRTRRKNQRPADNQGPNHSTNHNQEPTDGEARDATS